jgi:predicted lipoprotein with Yx(FWY)xxD motif
MKRLTGLLLCGLLVALAAAPADAMAAKRKGKLIKVEDSRYGPVLFDGKGRSIYLFTKEKGSRSRCYGDCAAAWPPVLTRARPRAGKGVDASKLGRTRRRGGRRQVTYGGHPLYYYVADTAPGEITCQDVFEFGGTWYLVGPDGSAVT